MRTKKIKLLLFLLAVAVLVAASFMKVSKYSRIHLPSLKIETAWEVVGFDFNVTWDNTLSSGFGEYARAENGDTKSVIFARKSFSLFSIDHYNMTAGRVVSDLRGLLIVSKGEMDKESFRDRFNELYHKLLPLAD